MLNNLVKHPTPLTSFEKLFKYNYVRGSKYLQIKEKGYIGDAEEVCIPSYIAGFQVYLPDDCSSLFEEKSSLKVLDLHNIIDTSNITNTSYMFADCTNLQSLNLKDFDTSNVTAMDEMFLGCMSLKDLDIADLDTTKVKSMSYMFSECKSLEHLDLSKFELNENTDMSYMFLGCESLKSLNISGQDLMKVQRTAGIFQGATLLPKELLEMFN